MIVIKFYDTCNPYRKDNYWYYCANSKFKQLNHFITKAYLFKTPQEAKEVADTELLAKEQAYDSYRYKHIKKNYLLQYLSEPTYKLIEVDDDYKIIKEFDYVNSKDKRNLAEIELERRQKEWDRQTDKILRCLGHD